MKKCVMCENDNIKEHLSTFKINLKGLDITVENVQSYRCFSCGEIYYPKSSCDYIDQQIKLKGIDLNE